MLPELRPIPGLIGYLAGSDGLIYSTWRRTKNATPTAAPRALSLHPTRDGYPRITIPVAPGSRALRHRVVPVLIAAAFHGPRPDGLQVRHLDGDKWNNRPENLRYGTALENAADREAHGTTVRGERMHNVHIPDDDVARAVANYRIGVETQGQIARRLGVRQSVVQKWCSGETRTAALEERIGVYAGTGVAA